MPSTPLPSESNGVLRFMTPIGSDEVTAFVSESALRARYGSVPTVGDNDVASIYGLHQLEINAAVARRIRAGARQPVVLRASDL